MAGHYLSYAPPPCLVVEAHGVGHRDEAVETKTSMTTIVVTSIVPSADGWPVAYYCPLCCMTVIVLQPYAVEPEKGGYYRVFGICVSETLGPSHNILLAYVQATLDSLSPPRIAL